MSSVWTILRVLHLGNTAHYRVRTLAIVVILGIYSNISSIICDIFCINFITLLCSICGLTCIEWFIWLLFRRPYFIGIQLRRKRKPKKYSCRILESNSFFCYQIRFPTFSFHHLYYRYGTRAPTEQCPVAVVIMSLQSIVGVVIQVIKHKRIS